MEEEILKACYIYVISDPYFHTLWPWHDLVDKLSDLKSDRAKWFAVETLAEVCCIGKESKSSILKKIVTEPMPEKFCLDYLYEEECGAKELPRSKNDEVTEKILPNSLCIVEGVLLPTETCENSNNFDFKSLQTRSAIIRDVALGIANRKHNFITVSSSVLEISYESFLAIQRFNLQALA